MVRKVQKIKFLFASVGKRLGWAGTGSCIPLNAGFVEINNKESVMEKNIEV